MIMIGALCTVPARDSCNQPALLARTIVNGNITALDGSIFISCRITTLARPKDGQEGLREIVSKYPGYIGLGATTHPDIELAEESISILGISLEMVTGEEPVSGKSEANVC